MAYHTESHTKKSHKASWDLARSWCTRRLKRGHESWEWTNGSLFWLLQPKNTYFPLSYTFDGTSGCKARGSHGRQGTAGWARRRVGLTVAIGHVGSGAQGLCPGRCTEQQAGYAIVPGLAVRSAMAAKGRCREGLQG
jgi:hypothetical protein